MVEGGSRNIDASTIISIENGHLAKIHANQSDFLLHSKAENPQLAFERCASAVYTKLAAPVELAIKYTNDDAYGT